MQWAPPALGEENAMDPLARSARALFPLILAIALVTPGLAATAATPPLADVNKPGSIIVYQKFQTDWVTVDQGRPDQSVQPRSLIELGATCPANMDCGIQDIVVRVRFHWVCPPQPDNAGAKFSSPGICAANDFFVNLTVNGKLWFTPNGGTTSGDLAGQPLPAALCNRGYLIGFVTNIGRLVGDNTAVFDHSDQPIKFDSLIGDAIMRNAPQDLQAFKALAIQGDPNEVQGGAIATTTLPNGVTDLPLDGGANHYLEVTGQLSGDVRFNSDLMPPFADTALILLTLDVNSNQGNQPTFVNLNFYNAQQQEFSEALSFTCWGEINIATIDPSLTQEGFGSERGQFQTFQASNNAQTLPTCPDGSTAGCVTLLGAVQMTEGPSPGPANATRSYTVPVFNNSLPIPTFQVTM